MHIFDAENWFSKVNFRRDEDLELHPKSEYHCPNCNETFFCLKDLDKHKNLDHSNLSTEDFKKFKRNGRKGCDSFLDFYCPKCKSPTKIYYRS